MTLLDNAIDWIAAERRRTVAFIGAIVLALTLAIALGTYAVVENIGQADVTQVEQIEIEAANRCTSERELPTAERRRLCRRALRLLLRFGTDEQLEELRGALGKLGDRRGARRPGERSSGAGAPGSPTASSRPSPDSKGGSPGLDPSSPPAAPSPPPPQSPSPAPPPPSPPSSPSPQQGPVDRLLDDSRDLIQGTRDRLGGTADRLLP